MNAARTALLVPLLLLGGLVALPALGAPAAEGEPVSLEDARRELVLLEGHLKEKNANNEDVIGGLNAVERAFHNVAPPAEPEAQEVPEGASEDERKAIETANKKAREQYEQEKKAFERDAPKFRDDAIDAFLDALVLERAQRGSRTNLRDDVNRRAAQVLGGVGKSLDEKDRSKVSKAVQTQIDKKLLTRSNKRDLDVPQILLEEAFAAVARLNDYSAIPSWYMENYLHTKSSPVYAVDALVAALKSLILFDVKEMPPKIRHRVVEKMSTMYAGTESSASQSKNDPATQSAKQFWDRIRTDAIRVVQVYSGEPQDEQGQVLDTMLKFQDWFRDNKDVRRPPWTE